ncbi:HAD family hydrolase [Paucilactobacillus kaifaensis]|uniref:HAD family hydrolase n=1 Tax=Paucilactobacillus kaifaensis TaxID=2559921 RepID=UPI0010F947ED|nr:HAD family hydrolase [Paucilactobacillus kaifaensis]
MKNFIFDVDGTLIDTIKMYIPALQQTLAKHGYQREYKELTKVFGITALDALRAVGVKEADLQPIFKEWFALAYQNDDQVSVFQGIAEMLTQLKAQPDIKLVIATSKTNDEYVNEFEPNFSISKYFDAHVTADDTQKHKPDPDPILAGLKKVNADPAESIYIGDTINDLTAAHAAGIKFGSALWGSVQPENLGEADFPLEHPSELIKLL